MKQFLRSTGRTAVFAILLLFFLEGVPTLSAAPGRARLISPKAGNELNSPEAVIRWKRAGSAKGYRLLVGKNRRSAHYYRSPMLGKKKNQLKVRGIPRKGEKVWVTLKTRRNGRWEFATRRYRAPLWNHLVDAVPVGNIPSGLLQPLVVQEGIPQFAPYLKHDVLLYRITYETTYKGQNILASGLVSFPGNAAPGYPMLVVQNGFIIADVEAPSAFSLSLSSPETSRFIGYEFLASAGYFVVFPDWIGFGASSQFLFPMYDYTHSVGASIDMMHAASEFIRSNRIPVGEKLFIAGYSMGGYVANCLLHALEHADPPGRQVTATALGAGGYNLVELMDAVLADETVARPEQAALFLTSYNETNGWQRPLTDFFQEPHASRIPSLLSGQFTMDEVFAELPSDIAQLLNPVFVQNMRDGVETEFLAALELNSIHDWSPVSRVRLYHSMSDERIPFSQSLNAYQNMVDGGSTQVEFVEIPEGDHFNAVFGFMELVLPWFESLR